MVTIYSSYYNITKDILHEIHEKLDGNLNDEISSRLTNNVIGINILEDNLICYASLDRHALELSLNGILEYKRIVNLRSNANEVNCLQSSGKPN